MRQNSRPNENLLYRYISFFPEINFARERRKNSTRLNFFEGESSLCSVFPFPLPLSFVSLLSFPSSSPSLNVFETKNLFFNSVAIRFIGSSDHEGRKDLSLCFGPLFIHFRRNLQWRIARERNRFGCGAAFSIISRHGKIVETREPWMRAYLAALLSIRYK